MAKQSIPDKPHPANLAAQEMKSAIPKLERRVAGLRAVDVSTIQEQGEPRMEALEQKIDDTLIEIFGNDTVEYRRYRVGLDTTPLNLFHGASIGEVREGYRRGIDQAISNLTTIAELFKEKLADLGESPAGRAIRAFGGLDLHPEIERVVGKLFHDGHYANAVEDACKVLDGMVKIRSGRKDTSGTDLMQVVFSPKSPTLRFNQLQTETERSEQQGMMYLYAGAMLALRNPRAHAVIQDHPEQALEYLGLLSMLVKALDRTERV